LNYHEQLKKNNALEIELRQKSEKINALEVELQNF
jgi:hypothetical protein